MNVSEARARAVERLTQADVPEPVRLGTPLLDADLLISSRLGVTRSYLMAYGERELGSETEPFLIDLEQRAKGIPVAYITGFREFWGLPFAVTPAVLIPKPDTETLVELALSLLAARAASIGSPTAHAPLSVLDICTGSGCVAISIAHDRTDTLITATDISAEALAVAQSNAERLLEPNRITFIQGDLREGIPTAPTPDGWDLIVSNPPYVPSLITDELLSDGRGEPRLALDGGIDGLDLVKELARQAFPVLRNGGILIVETGEYNARSAAAYFERCGYCDIVVHKDLEGQDRVVEGRKFDARENQ